MNFLKNLYARWTDIDHPLIKWGGALVIVAVAALFVYGLLFQWWV